MVLTEGPPKGSAVAGLKLMVMDVPVAPGNRSAAAIVRLTPVTCAVSGALESTLAADISKVGGGEPIVGFEILLVARKVPDGVETWITKRNDESLIGN